MKSVSINTVKAYIKSTVFTSLALFLVNMANAQVTIQPKPTPKFNRFAIGIRAAHLYDVKFKPNQILENGFIAEDMQGLKGNKTKFDMAFGIDASYFFTPLFSMDVAYEMGKMTGAGNIEYYTSDVSFLTLGANLNLKRAIRTKPYRLVPYLRASIANANYDVKRKFVEDDQTFNQVKDNCMQVGLGLGIRYHLTDNIHLNLMSEFVSIYSDAWDGYDYSSGNDHMVKTTLGLRYTFGKNKHVDRGLAWQDRRVDDLVAGNNNEVFNQALAAMSDSLRVMRDNINTLRNELNDRIARDNADTDKDGVLDRNDICPDTYGPTYNNGCPDTAKAKTANPAPVASTAAPKTTSSNVNLAQVRKMLLIEMNNIRFPAGKATLDDEALDILNRNAVVMKNNPEFKLIILGYTDGDGSNNLNMRLSRLRANAVANYLAKQGVPKDQLEVKAMGKANPVDLRNNERGKAANRRVEFNVETKH